MNKIIYTSSYDRGLEHLLTIWPEIKKSVPKATLDIYYGWLLFEQFYKDNPGSMQWHDKIKELCKQDGVTDHGRVSQQQLTEEYKTHDIFAYPVHFGEINCISAIKAQAYGSVPVVINYAALKETVAFGIKVEGDIYDKEVEKEYTKQLIWALQNPKWLAKVRKPMMKWASQITWDSIATQWTHVFRGERVTSVITQPHKPIVKIIDGYTGKETQ